MWQLYAMEMVSTAAPLWLPLGRGRTRLHTVRGPFDGQTWASIMR